MPKVTRIRNETCSKLSIKKPFRRHWSSLIVLLDSTPYSSVYIVNFKQVNVCFNPVSWHSIYTQAERDYCSTIFIVNFEQMTPCSSVFTVDFEHVFIFWVWSFNISIIFRLRWIQVPFIYRKDFLEVKYLHEVAYTVPCLFFISIFFQNFKTGVCKHYFFRTPFINYLGLIFQGKSQLSLVLQRISLGAVFWG